MFFGLYQLIVAISAGASACLWLIRPTRPVMGFVGGAGWTILALQARNITAYSNGTAIDVGSEAWQYLCLGLALLNLVTIVLWYMGVYPPVEEGGKAGVPGDPARMESEP